MKREWTTVLVLATIVAGGCGGSTTSRPQVSARELAFAAAVNLRRSDLPGLRGVGANHAAPSHGPFSPAVEVCDGGGNIGEDAVVIRAPFFFSPLVRHEDAALSSPKESQTAHSAVYFMPSAAVARRTVDAAGTRRGVECIVRHYFAAWQIGNAHKRERTYTDLQMGASTYAVGGIPVTRIHVTGKLATLIDMPARALDTTYIALLRKNSIIVLLSVSSHPVTLAAPSENRLVALLARRINDASAR